MDNPFTEQLAISVGGATKVNTAIHWFNQSSIATWFLLLATVSAFINIFALKKVLNAIIIFCLVAALCFTVIKAQAYLWELRMTMRAIQRMAP